MFSFSNASFALCLSIRYNVLPESNPTALAVFEYFDATNDGVIDQAEFEAEAEFFDPDITEEEIAALFIEADTDGDGLIELEDIEETEPAPPVSAPQPRPFTASPVVSPSKSKGSSPSKSKGSSPCSMIKGKKAKRKCLSKLKKPF